MGNKKERDDSFKLAYLLHPSLGRKELFLGLLAYGQRKQKDFMKKYQISI